MTIVLVKCTACNGKGYKPTLIASVHNLPAYSSSTKNDTIKRSQIKHTNVLCPCESCNGIGTKEAELASAQQGYPKPDPNSTDIPKALATTTRAGE